MFSYPGGDRARAGSYWNTAAWSIGAVRAQGGVLPGTPTVTYLRIPTALLLLVAPVMGLAYVVFLPLIATSGRSL